MEKKTLKLNLPARLMGLIWVMSSLLWALASVAGVLYGSRWLTDVQTGLQDDLGLLADNLDAVQSTLVESKDVLSETQLILTAVQTSTVDVTVALTDLRPLLWKTQDVVTNDVPNALDDLQDSMPTLIAAAKTVDDTLVWIAAFKIEIPIPLREPYVLDFGVEYAPEVPLDVALTDVSDALVGVPDDLRSMEDDLEAADQNIFQVKEDLNLLVASLEQTNTQLTDIGPQIDTLNMQLGLLQETLLDMAESAPKTITNAKNILKIVAGLIIFSQVPLLYFGLVLMRGKITVSDS